MSALNESMYTQYLAWYQGHRTKYGPKTAVLMQVGKFYEIYDKLDLETNSTNTNIREIADLCSLNLSEAKDPTNPKLLKLFGGFPEPSLPKFERQLLDNGYTVVVIVQKKDDKGNVEERVIDYISSPGIYNNGYSAGRDKGDRCLVGMILEPNGDKNYYMGLAAVDINTGNIWTTETPLHFLQNVPNIDAVEPFFLLHPPAELVCWWDGPAITMPTEAHLKAWFHLSDTVIHIRNDKPAKPGAQFMQECFSMKSSLQPHVVLNLERHPQAYKCIGVLLKFIEEHIPSLLKRLRNNTVWIPESRVRLGNAALQQLNIVGNSSVNDSNSLLSWLQTTYTAVGRRSLRERILTPISDIDELKRRYERIDTLKNLTTDISIEKCLRSVYDISRLHRKLHLSVLTTVDILHLLNSYKSIQTLIQKFHATNLEILNSSEILQWLEKRLSSWCIKRLQTADFGLLERTHPWPLGLYHDLDTVENSWNEILKEIHDYANTMTEPVTIISGDHTPFEFMTTKKRFEKMQNKSIQFNPSSSKSTSGTLESNKIYEFQKRGTQILRLWEKLHDEIWNMSLVNWSNSCDEQINFVPISEFITMWVANIDVEFSLARSAIEYNLTSPCFMISDTSAVEISGLRHPLIEKINPMSPYIKHDITLGKDGPFPGAAENGLLIYGTNASGKSSLMKALGIAVICAQTGIPVAAKFINLAPYRGIFTRILGNDNLWASLSSFAVEMTEFRAILKYADKNSLILGDELCSGTETRSATAIVSAGIQVLVKRGAQFLFATHLHEISESEEIKRLTQIKFAHLGVEYRDKQLVYNRNLQAGPGNSLYGLEVCYGLDMDEEFLALATRSRENKFSVYNSKVEIRKCEICGSSNRLETHHIMEQATAQNGFVDNGVQTNRASNLTVLCDFCHKEHHANRLVIQGWKDTSQGRQLQFYKNDTPSVQDMNLIKERTILLLRQKKKEKEIVAILQSEFRTTISIGELRKIKRETTL
jgi:DNA mismatch repair protein MutS